MSEKQRLDTTLEQTEDVPRNKQIERYNQAARSAEEELSDQRYFDAIENNDMETARRIVDAQAMKKGYISTDEFRMSHSAPNGHDDFSVNLAEVMNSDFVPKNYWTNPEITCRRRI